MQEAQDLRRRRLEQPRPKGAGRGSRQAAPQRLAHALRGTAV